MNFDFIFGDGVSGMAGYSLILILAALASKQDSVKRLVSRFAVNVRAQCYLDENSYHVFRHLDIRISGMHEQIDYVYVSRFGIFIVSTPNYQGRIWGDNGDGMWTQKFHRTKMLFPNPLAQNQRYIQALVRQLDLSPRLFYSVVVFSGNCQFQTMMPDNVIESTEFNEYIAQYGEIVLNDDKVAEIKEILESNEFDNVFGQNGSRSHA
ncbi:hypothetical protein NEIMUCOT_04246 [Neisseria mucosa ATCC 25996]|uniref:NERD domain-containing protein n=1 Tax=Neisseria mucosa (strain ATCC 25996 / DSM 4631 / NCTC 10774 / M26) TaxID=546266 RepID=D2ZUF8_NEIM2|nr:nuclease-related domain-containing protein [Neisseria mucosa]EFC89343.1 hypothetical protein NEIMUCOT_04246 [Neisseria mucosa ATCC 25996]SUA37659.1 Nuclease-related domain [Neisseria mucosa]